VRAIDHPLMPYMVLSAPSRKDAAVTGNSAFGREETKLAFGTAAMVSGGVKESEDQNLSTVVAPCEGRRQEAGRENSLFTKRGRDQRPGRGWRGGLGRGATTICTYSVHLWKGRGK
jgi:hypothetical protein